ncbi:MAG: hypothetical protein RLZZ172_2817 [Bacteroidota bacterium]|jgi:iron complex outermembrane receptor protein
MHKFSYTTLCIKTLNIVIITLLAFSGAAQETSKSKKDIIPAGRPALLNDPTDTAFFTNAINEVLVVGSRSSNRSALFSSVPVDVVRLSQLRSTGQLSLDKQLQFVVPSFNTVNIPVSDATTLLDPYEIRNLGPTRTLILINGKRKNYSSLVYIYSQNGRGETGADLSAIPTEAIQRVEILRDGASAQYGSDAIAGVINIMLRKDTTTQSLKLTSGITHKGDGFNTNLSYTGSSSLQHKGSLSYTMEFGQTNNAVRSGKVDPFAEKITYGGTTALDQAITSYLDRFPTANNINGTGATTAGKFLMNLDYPLNNTNDLYMSLAYCTKRVMSNANFRTPYWRTDAGLLHQRIPGAPNYTGTNDPLYEGYTGYLPSFDGDLNDYHASLGMLTEKGIIKQDASITIGGNQQLYSVNNTVNRSLGVNSPTTFKNGGYGFKHLVANYDLSFQFTKALNLALGSEFRSEQYNIIAGDTASFSGEGSNSFPGITRDNESVNSRINFGGYADLSWDISKRILINGAIRSENYSDFGNATVWKTSARYHTPGNHFVARASYSTGFRAPTLHQIYTQVTSALYSGGNILAAGIFKNNSKEVAALGVSKLQPEESQNLTFGVGLKPVSKMNITLDYYNILIKNRIILSNPIFSNDPLSPLSVVLSRSNISRILFFSNGINTKTAGLDLVMTYGPLQTSAGLFTFTFAGNQVLQNKIIGSPIEPSIIRESGASILNANLRSSIETSRPDSKLIVGMEYTRGPLTVWIHQTRIGSTKFQDTDNGGAIMEHIKQVFKPAMLTDLNMQWKASKKVAWNVSISNLFNRLPKWELRPLDATGAAYLNDAQKKRSLNGALTFNGRYDITSYSGAQFSQLGTTFLISVLFNL